MMYVLYFDGTAAEVGGLVELDCDSSRSIRAFLACVSLVTFLVDVGLRSFLAGFGLIIFDCGSLDEMASADLDRTTLNKTRAMLGNESDDGLVFEERVYSVRYIPD